VRCFCVSVTISRQHARDASRWYQRLRHTEEMASLVRRWSPYDVISLMPAALCSRLPIPFPRLVPVLRFLRRFSLGRLVGVMVRSPRTVDVESVAVLDVMEDLHVRRTEHSELKNALTDMPSPNAHPGTVVDGRLL
jgi:hypothetical protein